MIAYLISSFGQWSRLSGPSDDDFIDRLNHVWTTVLLALFAIITTSSQLVGDPIQCWCPGEFTSAFIAYTKSVCWVSNTYYIPMDERLPKEKELREKQELSYYQWVPLILLFMAFLFKLPNIFWHMLNGRSGINLDRVCRMAETTTLASPSDRMDTIRHMAAYIHRWLCVHRNYHYNVFVRIREKLANIFIFCFGRREGTFLTGFYLFTKLLYALNIIGQFFLLNAFLSMDYSFYGIEVLKQISNGESFKESKRFPRVTLCDFKIRQLENVMTYTIQCVLSVNLYNEKIFMFLWFWFCFLGLITFLNFASWLYTATFKETKIKYVRKFLTITGKLNTNYDRKLSYKFANDYLRQDGVFLLRVIGKNSSDMVLYDLVAFLWEEFLRDYCKHDKKKSNLDEESESPEKTHLNGHAFHDDKTNM